MDMQNKIHEIVSNSILISVNTETNYFSDGDTLTVFSSYHAYCQTQDGKTSAQECKEIVDEIHLMEDIGQNKLQSLETHFDDDKTFKIKVKFVEKA